MRFLCNKYFLAGLFLAVAVSLHGQQRITRAEYIERYKDLAIADQDVYGIPASITMAQALLESDNGNSRLATLGNNHFGIKCKKEWMGETITHDDDALQECFRKYDSVEDSFRDHSEFLDKSPRYQELFKLDNRDYQGWARGLKEAGYATNPQYADMLIKIIEDNRLYLLDEGKTIMAVNVEQPPVEDVAAEYTSSEERIDLDRQARSIESAGGYIITHNNGSDYVIALGDDTFERLATLFGVSAHRLREYNDMPAGSQPEKGQMVYIKSKSSRGLRGVPLHVVEEGETLWSVSQRYGIRLKKLAKLNGMDENYRISPGRQLRLY